MSYSCVPSHLFFFFLSVYLFLYDCILLLRIDLEVYQILIIINSSDTGCLERCVSETKPLWASLVMKLSVKALV